MLSGSFAAKTSRPARPSPARPPTRVNASGGACWPAAHSKGAAWVARGSNLPRPGVKSPELLLLGPLFDKLIHQNGHSLTLFVKRRCGSVRQRSFRAANGRGVRPTSARHRRAHAPSLLSRRVAYRAASLSVLVEQLVWPPPFRPADHAVSER